MVKNWERRAAGMTSVRIENRREARGRKRMGLWHRFVLLVGYAALLYGAIRGVLYLLVVLGGLA